MRRLLISVMLIASLVLLVACGDEGEEEAVADITPVATEDGTEGGPPPVSGQPTVTGSGLQIVEIEVGSGNAARQGQTVRVHYTGWPPTARNSIAL